MTIISDCDITVDPVCEDYLVQSSNWISISENLYKVNTCFKRPHSSIINASVLGEV